MKKLAVIAVSLFSLASTCNREDTVPRELWRRTSLPRLNSTSEYVQCSAEPLQEDQVVPKWRCGTPVEEKPDACDDVPRTREEASAILVTRPLCVDRAIQALQRYSFTDPLAPNDLAAAYFVRAQREDQPLDFFRALEAAEQAIPTGEPAALFNYALIQETLGFTDEAIAAWDRYLAAEPSPQWAAEGRNRRDALTRMRSQDARRRWEAIQTALPEALKKADRAEVARLIDPFPRSAWVYFEEEVLGRWAAEPTAEHVREAQLYAEELAKRTQDRFALDVVARLSEEVREAHKAHSEGIREYRAQSREVAAKHFEKASAVFARTGNPMLLSAKIYLGTPDVDGTTRYPHLHAQSRARRGYDYFATDRYLEALLDFEGAQAEFHRLGDGESTLNLYANTLGMYRILDQSDSAARLMFRARNYATILPDAQRRNLYLGEAATLALDLGYKRAALNYQNSSVALMRAGLSSAQNDAARRHFTHNLAIALRGRAGVYAALGRYDLANHDLKELVETSPPSTLRVLQARISEVEARTLPPAEAVAKLTEAIALAGAEYSTFRADLHAKRSSALRRLNRHPEAENDLRKALELVRWEEDRMLNTPRSREDTDEIIWNLYFSRFDATYDDLVTELLASNRSDEAFEIAEESRAYEPLKRLLEFGTAATGFRKELSTQRHLTLPQIRKHLPADAALVAYAVLEDKTVAWIVTRDGPTIPIELRATPADIVRWSTELEDAVRHRADKRFVDALTPPYAPLIAPVLEKARKLRLVIIPDDAMYGLPFSALRAPRSERFLVEQAIVSIAPSATLYVHSLLRDAELPRTGKPTALLFGNPAFDPRLSIARKLRRLPDAEREVAQVAALYGAVPYTHEAATVSEFLRSAPRAEIVQVAAHGIVNARVPAQSAVLLAPDAQHNGVLDADTLLKQLHAEQTRLMVLSACSSAGGLPVGSEGVAPLVRPILAAGVPGVVGTLWDVADATSADLMVSFHRHYRSNRDAALALHDAQIEMVKKDAAPRYWAPFQVIGHASSPFAAPERKKEKPLELHSANHLHGPDGLRSQ